MGDVLELAIARKSYPRRELEERSADMPLRFHWTRGRALGLVKAMSGRGAQGSLYLGRTRIEVSPDDTVRFHAVGEFEPASRRLVEVDQIILG
jgi:hypothetical protein